MIRQKHGLSIAERKSIKRLLMLMFILALLWITFAPGRGLLHFHRLRSEVNTLSSENRGLAERNAELKAEIEQLRSDDAYLEALAREKHGLLKKNETIYQFTPSGK